MTWMLLALSMWVSAPQDQHAHGGLGTADLGTVNFETSCKPTVKVAFNRAVAELHSFWFAEARKGFEDVLKADGNCAIAHWGIALTHWGNPFAGLRSAQTIAAGKAAITRGQEAVSASPRERALIDAVAGLFSSDDAGTQRARVVAYEAAMAKVAADNPKDDEARIFWALAIAQIALPTDKTFAEQLRAAGILEPMFKAQPNHPGLAHYIIHAYDAPPLADKALAAARSYASIAPAVPHALHMPSHTFTRVGLWKESVATNIKSADAAVKAGSVGEELHALDYEMYAYLQMADDAAAKAVMTRAYTTAGLGDGTAIGPPGGGGFPIAAIPARFAMERRQWTEAANLLVRPSNTAYVQAITHFARAIGAAQSGKPAAAAPDIAQLGALRDKLVAGKDAYWAEQVDIQRRVAEAFVTFARGQKDEGIKLLAEAATAEDATDKAAVTPGPIAPARELLGFMLLDAGRPADALAAFDATIKKEPNRFNALYGAGRAAEAAKDTSRARLYYSKLVEICKDTTGNRPELEHARKFVR